MRIFSCRSVCSDFFPPGNLGLSFLTIRKTTFCLMTIFTETVFFLTLQVITRFMSTNLYTCKATSVLTFKYNSFHLQIGRLNVSAWFIKSIQGHIMLSVRLILIGKYRNSLKSLWYLLVADSTDQVYIYLETSPKIYVWVHSKRPKLGGDLCSS